MLDTTTKKRIDDCRDILVGKLPDPKAQIEQITIALIYKFMDDMDKEAIELGGQAKFFSDYKIPDPEFPNDRNRDTLVEFSKYAWDQLMHPRVTAAEMLTIYSQAIEGMAKNPNIPQLFRDIFNNAYLPYRDPETLKFFLKTIGEFDYNHSENLGDAFEYLLSVMGSQGDAGQFRTPRHIIDFVVAVVAPDKNDSILDPACGTAGFLISAYKYILGKYSNGNGFVETQNSASLRNDGKNVQTRYSASPQYHQSSPGDQLSPDDRKKLIHNFTGYDISPDMVRLSLVNMYLHGFSTPSIHEYDTLSSEDRWNDTFDVILANPPFMSPKGGIRPHKRFTISGKRSEVLFVDYIAEHLNPNGKAGVIVPEGIIFQSGRAYKDLRKMLVENYLYAVVSLPAGVFNPYSGVKTSILLMDKKMAKQTEEILFVKIDNDGYNLGAQRTPIKGEQLTEAIQIIHEYRVSGSGKDAIHGVSLIAHLVPKSEIAKNGEYNLSGERYKSQVILSTKYKSVKIGDICRVINGRAYKKEELLDSGKYPVLRVGNFFSNRNWYYSDLELEPDKYCTKGDLLYAWSASFGPKIWDGGKCIYHYHIWKLKPDEDVVNKYFLYYILNRETEAIMEDGGRGLAMIHITKEGFEQRQIPLPPLSVQEEIVAEIEAYQKIIDGAKAIVENYKPHIDIDPDWEMVELGEVCEVNPQKSELKGVDEDLEVSFLPMADLNENQIDFEPKQSKSLKEVIKGYTYFRDDDVLLAKVTPCFENGKAGIAKGLLNGIGFGSSEYYVIRPNEKILSTWIYLNVTTNDFRKRGKNNMTGTGGLQRVPKDFVETSVIPLPSIEIQRQIVSQIEKEQELVNANKQLIEIFEQKIKDRIAKVWGEKKEEDLSVAAEPQTKYGK